MCTNGDNIHINGTTVFSNNSAAHGGENDARRVELTLDGGGKTFPAVASKDHAAKWLFDICVKIG